MIRLNLFASRLVNLMSLFTAFDVVNCEIGKNIVKGFITSDVSPNDNVYAIPVYPTQAYGTGNVAFKICKSLHEKVQPPLITNATENSFVTNFINEKGDPQNNYWLGFNNTQCADNTTWLQSYPSMEVWTNWWEGIQHTGKDCECVIRTTTGQWMPQNCNWGTDWRIICQISKSDLELAFQSGTATPTRMHFPVFALLMIVAATSF